MTEEPTPVRRLPLWPGRPEHARGNGPQDHPTLDVYLPEPEHATGAAMLIFPGGCYTFRAPRSSSAYASWFAEHGIAGIVVNFRLGPDGYHGDALLADARQSCRVARAMASQWGVDQNRIGAIGTSAGGHLAAMLVTGAAFEDSAEAAALRPAVGVLCYAVVSMLDPIAHEETRSNFLGTRAADKELQERYSGQLRVTEATAACFVWHTITDEEVPAQHSELFASALRDHGVPYELHLYGHGSHALGLARTEGLHWAEDCLRWLRAMGMTGGGLR